MKLSAVLTAGLGCLAAAQDVPFQMTKELGDEWFGDMSAGFRNVLKHVQGRALQELDEMNVDVEALLPDMDNLYYNFLPDYLGAAIPDGDALSFEGNCFSKNTLTAVTNSTTGLVDLTLDSSKKGLLCSSDIFLLATMDGLSFQEVSDKGTKSISWRIAPETEALEYDLSNKGIRVFRFDVSIVEALLGVVKTLAMFIPEITPGVPDSVAKLNVDFLSRYETLTMEPRQDVVDIDESMISSGDWFGIMRLDGLDPMISWGSGAIGHSVVAMWEDDELYMYESTVTDSYWPTNGVQRNKYSDWVPMARKAQHNTFWMPLRDDLADKFDVDAALEYFHSVEGVDYGYQNMLWGWIDADADGSVKSNMPCTAGDKFKDQCLSWELVEVLFGNIERFTDFVADQMYGQAMNHRLGTSGLSMSELMYEAHKQGIPADNVAGIVEDDSWVYNTTRNGEPTVAPQSVCSTFVCHTWKAGGLFDDMDVNCGEFTPRDLIKMQFFQSPDTRPQECKDNDPDLDYCQITGNWSLPLPPSSNNFTAPYEHMNEHCATLAPNYEQEPGC